MRLIDRIREAEKTGRYNFWSDVEPLLDDFFGYLNDPNLPIIDVTNVADYVGADLERFNGPIQEVISCALPPFSSCWMECDPQRIAYLSSWGQIGVFLNSYDMRHWSCEYRQNLIDSIHVPAHRQDHIKQAAWLVRGDFSSMGQDGEIGCLWGVAYFFLDVNGMIVRPMLGGHRVDQDVLEKEDNERLNRIIIETMALF